MDIKIGVSIDGKMYGKGINLEYGDNLNKINDLFTHARDFVVHEMNKRREEKPMIQVTRARLNYVKFEVKSDGKVDISGSYNLITSKGDVIAKQEFNTYDTVKISFDGSIGKDVAEAIESNIEMQLGVQEAVKQAAAQIGDSNG